MKRPFFLGKGGWVSSSLVSLLLLSGVVGCSVRTTDEEAELARSTFFPGQAAASVMDGSDGGFIPGPGGGDGQNDGGTVPPPGGSDSGSDDGGNVGGNPGGNADGGSGDSGDTGGDVADNDPPDSGNPPADNPDNGSTSGSDNGDVAGGTGSGGTSGNDGGTIPGGDTGATGGDNGNVAGGDTGGTGGDTGSTGGGDTGGTGDTGGDVADNDPPNNGNPDDGTTPGDNPDGDTGGNDNGDVADNDPPDNGDGSDGGTIPGGDDGGDGGDGGNVGTPMDIHIGRVCSVMRSGWNHWVFFEEANRPILSFEAYKPVEQQQQFAHYSNSKKSRYSRWFRQYMQRRNYWAYAGGFWNFGTRHTQSNESVSIQAIDLSQVDLFGGPYSGQIHFDEQALRDLFPEKWENVVVRASVCDDTNQDGRCSDESQNSLSVRHVTFLGKNVPNHLRVDVWHGRHFTLRGDPEMCEKQYSPLVLDLKNNGIVLTAAEQGVVFDLNDTGNPVYTGWIGSRDDAFLVRDLDDNGNIDSGAELFGSATRLLNGERAENGFEALKELDSNRDNKMTPADAAWGELQLWRDLNYNAQMDWGEVMSLDRARVHSIDLNYVDIMEVDKHGNETRQRSIFRRRLWRQLRPQKIVDVWFRTLRRD